MIKNQRTKTGVVTTNHRRFLVENQRAPTLLGFFPRHLPTFFQAVRAENCYPCIEPVPIRSQRRSGDLLECRFSQRLRTMIKNQQTKTGVATTNHRASLVGNQRAPTPTDSASFREPVSMGLNREKGGNGWRGNRTPDTRIFSPLLYQLSYPAVNAKEDTFARDFARLHVNDF